MSVVRLAARVLATATVLARGAGVGALATAADLLALVVLVHVGLTPVEASVPALAVGVAVQFVGSKFFTFESRARGANAALEGALFLAVEAAAFALNALLFAWAVGQTFVPFAVVRLAVTSLVYFAFSLPLWSFTFRIASARRERRKS